LGAEPLRFDRQACDNRRDWLSATHTPHGCLELQQRSNLSGAILTTLDMFVDAAGTPFVEFAVDPAFERVPHTGMV